MAPRPAWHGCYFERAPMPYSELPVLIACPHCAAFIARVQSRAPPRPDSDSSQRRPQLENEVERLTEYAQLTLHVPEPAVRPGGTPDRCEINRISAGQAPSRQ